MTRRIPLFALALLLAIPASAKRRAVLSGAPGHCQTGIITINAFAGMLAVDDRYVYWIEESEATLRRVPMSGGPSQRLAFLQNWVPLSMAVDDTHVYLGAIPAQGLFTPQPGNILSIPKSGGTLGSLVSGVLTPLDVEVDATHLYWVATGTVDFQSQTIAPDGKIERALKNGSARQTLAGSLSAPLDLLLDGDAVFFGETGVATGDPTVGLYVVSKSGGAVTTIDSQTASAYLAPAGAAIVVSGGNATVDNAIFVIRKDRGGVRTLVADDDLSGGARVFDGVAYYVTEEEIGRSLWAVPVVGGTPVRLRHDLLSDDFEVDACAITVGTVRTTLERMKR